MTQTNPLFMPHHILTARAIAKEGGGLLRIAEGCGVSLGTARHWALTVPEFAKACRADIEAKVRNVEEALYSRAIGYDVEEDKAFLVKDHQTKEHHVLTERVIKHYPPDVRAAEAFLQHHAGWKSTTGSSTTVNNNTEPAKPDLTALTDAELEAYEALVSKMAETNAHA